MADAAWWKQGENDAVDEAVDRGLDPSQLPPAPIAPAVDDDLRPAEPTEVPTSSVANPFPWLCRRCGASNVSASPAAAFKCSTCAGEMLVRCCPTCSIPLLVPPDAIDRHDVRARCRAGHLKKISKMTAWVVDEDPELDELMDFYASVGMDIPSALTFPQRRVVEGKALESLGFNIDVGDKACFRFEREALLLVVDDRVITISYPAIHSLRVGGRGQYQTVSGGGFSGGGFGVAGFVGGALAASAMNAATTRRTSHVETIVVVEWSSFGFALLHSKYTPRWVEALLSPFGR